MTWTYLLQVVASIGHGIGQNARGERGDSHWMDVSKKEYGHELVEDVKSLLGVLVLFIPVPIWWALFDQTGSRWTFQVNIYLDLDVLSYKSQLFSFFRRRG